MIPGCACPHPQQLAVGTTIVPCDWSRKVVSRNPILIAEDNEDDAELVRLAIGKAGIPNPVHIVRNGAEVLLYLKAEPPYTDRAVFPFPRLLLVDLKMPVLNGFEVLEWLRSHPDCGVIPTIVISASRLEEDLQKAYRLRANAYIVKPTQFEQFVEIFRRLNAFCEICELPTLPAKC